MTILITAGTGNVGRELVLQLANENREEHIRVGTRNPSSDLAQLLQRANPTRIVPFRFDPDDVHTLGPALDGVTKLVLIVPIVDDMVDWQRRVLDKVPNSVSHIVKLSVQGARPNNGEPKPGKLPLAHWEGEEMVRAKGVRCNMVRPTMFMQHFIMVPALYEAGDDTIYMPSGLGKIAMNDCRDIAAVMQALLGTEQTGNSDDEVIEFTGPEALTGDQMAEWIGLAAGRVVERVDGKPAFDKHADSLGAPKEIGSAYAEAGEGWFEKVNTAQFERLVGRRPNTFASFAYENRAYFTDRDSHV